MISIEQQFATCKEENGLDVTFDFAIERPYFVEQFSGVDLSQTRQLSYEPERGLYHILELDYSLTVLDDPSSDPRMAFVHNNKDAIRQWFGQKQNEAASA